MTSDGSSTSGPHEHPPAERGVDSVAVRRDLLETYDIEIGASAGAYASTVWRTGLMGRNNARPDAVLLVLAALKDGLGRG